MAATRDSEPGPDVASASGGTFDFSFAFMNRDFSDCVLRLNIHGGDHGSARAPPCTPLPGTSDAAAATGATDAELLDTPDIEEVLYLGSRHADSPPTATYRARHLARSEENSPHLLPLGRLKRSLDSGAHDDSTAGDVRVLRRRFMSPVRAGVPDSGDLTPASCTGVVGDKPLSTPAGASASDGEEPGEAASVDDSGKASGAPRTGASSDAGAGCGAAAGSGPEPGSGGVRVEEIFACAVILAAKSEFFRKMLTGQFADGKKGPSGTRVLNLHLMAAEEQAFKDMLQYVHSGSLPALALQSLDCTLDLLLLADRFAVLDCAQACVRHLTDLNRAGSIGISEAVSILNLPETLRETRGLDTVFLSAKQTLQAYFNEEMNAPELLAEMGLPQVALTSILQAEDVGGSSEDDLALLAILWGYHNSNGHSEFVRVLTKLGLPHLQPQCLSPSMVKLLCSVLEGSLDVEGFKVLLEGTLCASVALSDSTVEFLGRFLPSRSRAQGAAGGGSDWDSEAAGDAHAEVVGALGDALLLMSEHNWITSRAVPKGWSLRSVPAAEGGAVGPALWGPPRPRKGTQFGCAARRIFLDVPISKCRDWRDVAPIQKYLATSSYVSVSGRWMCLAASVYDQANPKLRVSLKYDPAYGGPPARADAPKPFRVAFRIAAVVASTTPAYQVLKEAVSEVSAHCCSIRVQNPFQKPWAEVLASAKQYMPAGCLQLCADVWVHDEGEE